MDTLKGERRQAFNTLIGTIVAVLSVGHFVVLGLGVTLAKELDELDSHFVDFPKDWYSSINTPFALALGLLGAVQLFACLAIVYLNRRNITAGKINAASLAGIFASFTLSVVVTTTTLYYNQIIQRIPKNQRQVPTAPAFYHWLQVDGIANGLISFPLLCCLFYNNLENYFKENHSAENQPRKEIWVMSLLLNACALIAFVIQIYIFIDKENPESYGMEGSFSPYIFCLLGEVIVSVIAFVVLLFHFQPFSFLQVRIFKSCLHKKQVVLVVVVAAMCQFGIFVLMVVKTAQLYIDDYLTPPNGRCFLFSDCEEAGVLRREITAYTIITFFLMVVLLFGFKDISGRLDYDKSRSLLSEGNQRA